MKLEDFRRVTKESYRGVKIFEIPPEVSQLYHELTTLKGLVKYIDFDCQINKLGGCKTHTSVKCCCSGCRSDLGYLYFISEKMIKTYARRFNENTGFWRKGKGCALDHNLRSHVCLSHHCNNDNNHFDTSMSKFKEIMRKGENRIICEYERNKELSL